MTPPRFPPGHDARVARVAEANGVDAAQIDTRRPAPQPLNMVEANARIVVAVGDLGENFAAAARSDLKRLAAAARKRPPR